MARTPRAATEFRQDGCMHRSANEGICPHRADVSLHRDTDRRHGTAGRCAVVAGGVGAFVIIAVLLGVDFDAFAGAAVDVVATLVAGAEGIGRRGAEGGHARSQRGQQVTRRRVAAACTRVAGVGVGSTAALLAGGTRGAAACAAERQARAKGERQGRECLLVHAGTLARFAFRARLFCRDLPIARGTGEAC